MQSGIPFLLPEWALMQHRSQAISQGYSNNTRDAIMGVWKVYERILAPGQPVIASVLNHFGFQVAQHCSNFGKWIQGEIHQYHQLIKRDRILSEQEVVEKIGNHPLDFFQYKQIKNFLCRYLDRGKLGRSPTAFESLLT